MRRCTQLASLTWLLGCGPAVDDDHDGPAVDDVAHDPSQAAQDREECLDPTIPDCPPGFAFQLHSGRAHEDLMVVELEDAAVPVCNGHGSFIPAGSIEDGALLGVHVTRNSLCTFGCLAGCATGSSCVTTGAEGPSCAVACADIDEEGCTELVRSCAPGSC